MSLKAFTGPTAFRSTAFHLKNHTAGINQVYSAKMIIFSVGLSTLTEVWIESLNSERLFRETPEELVLTDQDLVLIMLQGTLKTKHT